MKYQKKKKLMTLKKFKSKYIVDPFTDCHQWIGCIITRGKYHYPVFRINNKWRRAILYVYERKHGPVASRTQFYNICGLDTCVNEQHWVTDRSLLDKKIQEYKEKIDLIPLDRKEIWDKVEKIHVFGKSMELKGHIVNFELAPFEVEAHRRFDCEYRDECLTVAAHIENARRDEDKGGKPPYEIQDKNGNEYKASDKMSFSCRRCSFYR